MRIKKMRIFGSMREFVMYESVEEFMNSGRLREELLFWEHLPRYKRTRSSEVAYVAQRLEDLKVNEKMLVTTEHHVIPIVGMKRQINRQRKLIAVFLDTAYGRFELKYGYYCKEGIGKQVQYHHQSFVSNIAACKDFWAGFALTYPVQWEKLDHDPFRAINWLKTRYIINQEFFERIRREMTDDGYIKLVEQILPTAEAKTAAAECMKQTEDLKVKSTTALGILELALEVSKLMDKPFAQSSDGKTATAFPLPADNVPQPFIPVGKQKDN